jgi:hypothetical protein
MKSIGLAFFTDTHWTLLALLLFFSTFFILLILQFRFFSKDKEDHLVNLPFEEDPHESK